MVSAAQSVVLRVSLTSRCPLRCFYCRPECGTEAEEQAQLSAAEIARFVDVVGRTFSLAKVHLTGGEPLLRSDIVDLVASLSRRTACDLAVTTNGQMLTQLAAPLARAGLGRVNVSLDSMDRQVYADITRGGDVDLVLDGVDHARRCGLQVKLNTVVLRGVNDDEVTDIARWGLQQGCTVRFLELMPIGPAADMFHQLHVPSADVQTRLRREFDLAPLPAAAGGTARRFLASGRGGTRGLIGFISGYSHPFCRACRRLRLTASGQLVGCLARGMGPDVRALLASDGPSERRQLIAAIRATLELKRADRRFTTGRMMIQTGG